MSVKTVHPEYLTMSESWKRCRDAAAGQTAVHAAATEYLPMLSEQTAGEYDAYKGRANFYNATWRTIAGLQGMLFRKPAVVKVEEVVKPLLEDVSLCGESLHMFTLGVVKEALTVGRVGIFVDYPTTNPEETTKADSERLGLRPIMKQYTTESIINWRKSVVNNRCMLTMVVLAEVATAQGASEFEEAEVEQYRVLDFVKMPKADGTTELVYRVRVFQIDKDGKDVMVDEAFPVIGGKTLTELPFYVVSTDSVDICPDVPPLIDLVDINLSHYRTTADYEHGCHFTGLPTPVITGFTPDKDKEKFGIGSMTAWVFPRPDAKAFYLEFTGQGLAALEKNLARKEVLMAVLGARMLESKQDNGASANGAAINMGGELSLLASISLAASIAIERALTMFGKFEGAKEASSFRLNKDFFPTPMGALELTALVASWQNGAISYATLFDNLQKGEVIAIDQTIVEELARMDQHKPEIPAGTKVNQSETTGNHETTLAGSSGNNPTQRQLQTPKG